MLYPNFKKTILSHDLLKEGDKIIVAVSGGVDSMVLLHLFCRLSKSTELELAAAHVNHGLRGRASDKDERLVERSCTDLGISLFKVNSKPKKGDNIQDAARRIRLGFFRRVSKKLGGATVATAHHRGDQAETILLHLIRGAGLGGLSGMKPRSQTDDLDLIRPLLDASREDIESYAKKHDIEFREDASNLTTKYTRNAIRHKLIPLLREFNPRIDSNLALLGRNISEDEEALGIITDALLEDSATVPGGKSVSIDRKQYLELPVALRKRLLRGAYVKLTGTSANLNSDQLRRMDEIAVSGEGGASYRLRSPLIFRRSGQMLRIERG